MGLLGPNGAGKTTAIRLLAGSLRPQRGTVSFNGCSPQRDRGRYQRLVGCLPQDLGYPGHMVVSDYVAYVGWLKGLSSLQAAKRAADALDVVGLTTRMDDRLRTLSGGMLRRVGLAQAIVHEPSLVLLDEPSVGLDPEQRQAMRATIAELGRDRLVVVSTHLTDDVAAICAQVGLLLDGRLRALDDIGDFVGDRPVTAEAVERAYLATVSAS